MNNNELIKYFQKLDDDIQDEKINLYTTDELNKEELKKNLLILKDIINSKFSKSFNDEKESFKKTLKSQLNDLKKNINDTLKIIDNNNYSLSESDDLLNDLGIIDEDFINYFEPVKKKEKKKPVKKPVKKEVKKSLNQLKKEFSLLLSALKGKKNALQREQSYTKKDNEKINKLKNELKDKIKKYKENQKLIKQMKEKKEKEIIEKKEKKNNNNNNNIDTNKKMANPWIEHVKKCRAEHPEWTYRQALKECKATYKKNVETKAKPTKKTKKSKINVDELLKEELPPLPKSKPPKGHFVDGKFYPYPNIPAPPIPKKQKNLSDKIKKFMDK